MADGLAANATASTAELTTHAGDPNAHHVPSRRWAIPSALRGCLTKIRPLALLMT